MIDVLRTSKHSRNIRKTNSVPYSPLLIPVIASFPCLPHQKSAASERCALDADKQYLIHHCTLPGYRRKWRTSLFASRPGHAREHRVMRFMTRSCYKARMADRVLVHLSRIQQRVLDPADVFVLSSAGGETEIRLRSRTPLIDVRPLGEVAPIFERFGFVRVHRRHAVNVARVRLLRLQADGRDWELKLEPPVNSVLPIARDRIGALRAALGEPG